MWHQPVVQESIPPFLVIRWTDISYLYTPHNETWWAWCKNNRICFFPKLREREIWLFVQHKMTRRHKLMTKQLQYMINTGNDTGRYKAYYSVSLSWSSLLFPIDVWNWLCSTTCSEQGWLWRLPVSQHSMGHWSGPGMLYSWWHIRYRAVSRSSFFCWDKSFLYWNMTSRLSSTHWPYQINVLYDGLFWSLRILGQQSQWYCLCCSYQVSAQQLLFIKALCPYYLEHINPFERLN